MDLQLFLIVLFNFIIHLVGTLAFAFRIAGIRTGHIAIAFSLFNVLVLISRLANSFQGPFLAKRVETAIQGPALSGLTFDFMLVIASASLATLAGGLLIPTFQRYSTRAVAAFQRTRSMPRLLLRSLTPRGVSAVAASAALPNYRNLQTLRGFGGVPAGAIMLNFVATALWTVGVMAAIYAGAIDPEFRVTAATLSSIINGVATVIMFIMIDPFLSGLTDDVVHGRANEAHFRRVVVWMVASRFAGTVAAQALLLPGATAIAAVARWI